jgi:hypothetical protein
MYIRSSTAFTTSPMDIEGPLAVPPKVSTVDHTGATTGLVGEEGAVKGHVLADAKSDTVSL